MGHNGYFLNQRWNNKFFKRDLKTDARSEVRGIAKGNTFHRGQIYGQNMIHAMYCICASKVKAKIHPEVLYCQSSGLP
jgi:hypothetical protein